MFYLFKWHDDLILKRQNDQKQWRSQCYLYLKSFQQWRYEKKGSSKLLSLKALGEPREREEEVKVELEIERGAIISPVSQSVLAAVKRVLRRSRESWRKKKRAQCFGIWLMCVCFLSSGASRLRWEQRREQILSVLFFPTTEIGGIFTIVYLYSLVKATCT